MPSLAAQSRKSNLAKTAALVGATLLPAVSASPAGANVYTYTTSATTSSIDWVTGTMNLSEFLHDFYFPTGTGDPSVIYYDPQGYTYASSSSSSSSSSAVTVTPSSTSRVSSTVATTTTPSSLSSSSSSSSRLASTVTPSSSAAPTSVYKYSTTAASSSSYYSFSLPPGNWETLSLTFQELSDYSTMVIPGLSSTESAESTATTATSYGNPPPAADSEFAKQMIRFHNEKRALHEDTGPLTWSDDLAVIAQNLANQYDCSGVLYEGYSQYGENLAFGCGWEDCFALWYDEISLYNYSIPMYSPDTGHFTQIVWKDSTEVGCGYKSCPGWWGYYMVCEYNPKGNMLWSFKENVLPPIDPEDNGYITIPSELPAAATATFA